jgi:hypothetical protein
MRLTIPSASLFATVAALVLAGCGGNVDFSITRTFNVNSTVSSGRAPPADIDLAAEAGSAWKQRKHIDKITIHSVTAEVLSVTTGSGLALTGTAWVHEPGVTDETQWIQVGPASGTFQVGEVLDLPITPALNTFLTTQLRNDGQFVLVAEGTSTGGAIAGQVRVTLDATLKWKAF